MPEEKDPKKTNPDELEVSGIAAAALEGAGEAQPEPKGVGMTDPRSSKTTSSAVGDDEQAVEDADPQWRRAGGGPDAVEAEKSARKSIEQP
jgi:hypothetical protein